MWDKMKESEIVKTMAKKIKETESFKKLSEQSIYTIAFDMMNFKKYKKGEMICP